MAQVRLSNQQTGDGASTNIVDLGPSHKSGSVKIRTSIGATPTCTYALQVSVNGSDWTAATYSDVGTPTVDETDPVVITTATTVEKIIKQPAFWRYFRVLYSANTNVTNTADFLYTASRHAA